MNQKVLGKRFYLFIGILLILTLFISIGFRPKTPIASVAASESAEAKCEKQKDSSDQNEKILNSFEKEGKVSYPSYYGGSYIDADNDLVILLSEDSTKVKSQLKSISKNPNLKFKSAKYSYNKLTDIINAIWNGVEQNHKNKKIGIDAPSDYDIYGDITGTVLLDDQNKIEVYINDLDDLKINKLKNLIKENDALIFKESIPAVVE